jgi:predicted acylesterase/phospholipase RssA
MARLLACSLFLASLCLSSPAFCQELEDYTPGDFPPLLGLTVSGGVSLGSFEAGYLYYLFETLKLNPGVAEPRIFTGASAGSANALMSLLSSCSDKDPEPDKSLFYQTWIPVGLKELFDPKKVTARGLFTQRALQARLEDIGARWRDGLPQTCDATLGLSTTRATAAKVELVKDRVTLARTEAKFVVRVRGQGPGKPPMLTNYVGSHELLQRPLLPTEQDGSISFDALKRVLLASAAFPLAFEPVAVAHCSSSPTPQNPDDIPACTPQTSEVRLFVDGGVFDNQPLRLAVQLAQQGIVGVGKQRHFVDVPSVSRQKLREDTLFVYVDPSVEVLPNIDAREGLPDHATVPYALYLFEQLVESSRSKELQVLLEDDPEVTKQITATHTYFMPLSDPLYSFFGFFETDFRIHDFYLGMHGAHRWFQEVISTLNEKLTPVYPEDAYGKENTDAVRSWAPYRCMRFAFDGVGEKSACKSVSQSVRAGIQTSLDRIYARCAELAHKSYAEGKPIPQTAHAHCRRAFLGEVPPLLQGMRTSKGFEFEPGESPLEHELRRLATHGFHFRDMGVPRDRSHEAKRYVAQRVGTLVRALADQQDSGVYRAIFPVAGRIASQAMSYVPPYTTWHVLMARGLEGGYSGANPDGRASWLRGTLALELDGLLTLVSTGSANALKVTALIGGEVEIPPLTTWQYQTRIGLRGGYGFSTHDKFMSEPCDDGVSCSRARGEVYVALTLYQLLRFQFAFALYPPMPNLGLDWDYAINPRLGVEFDRP